MLRLLVGVYIAMLLAVVSSIRNYLFPGVNSAAGRAGNCEVIIEVSGRGRGGRRVGRADGWERGR